MNLLKRFFTQPEKTGALIDSRSQDEKEKDYTTVELYASAAPVKWTEKPKASWRAFPVLDQVQSSSCVAQTMKKILGVQHLINHGSYVSFSAAQVYQQRRNKPSEGMSGVDSFDIVRKNGIVLEELLPSDKKNEAYLNTVIIQDHHKKVAEVFKISNHVGIPQVSNIDAIASVIQHTGKAVMVWFYFTSQEWGIEVPVVRTALSGVSDSRSLRHSVAAVDFTMYKGKKALIIEDSAHFGGLHRRIVTEDFLKARCFFAHYPMNFVFQVGTPDSKGNRPTHLFTKHLSFIPLDSKGEISDADHFYQLEDVKKLQDILRYEGFLASNIDSTGYYGSITARAVLDFQSHFMIGTESEVRALRGRVVGPKTIQFLNKQYS